MRAILFIIIVVLSWLGSALLFSCRGPITTSREVYDSTHVEYRDRLVTYRVPADSAKLLPIRIECDPVTNKPKPVASKKKSGRATVTASIDQSGYLQATSNCDSLQGVINAKDEIITKQRWEIESRTEVQYRIPGIYKASMLLSIVTIIMIVLMITFKLKGWL